MIANKIKFLFFLTVAVLKTQAANILFVFPLPSPSHETPIRVLIEALAARGHHITLISPFTLRGDLGNYTEVNLGAGIEEYRKKSLKRIINFNTSGSQTMKFVLESGEVTRITMESSGVQALLKSNKKFDVIVQQLTLCEALLGLGYLLKAPTIILNTVGTLFNINRITGNSQPYAYVPPLPLPLTDEMTFSERLENTLFSLKGIVTNMIAFDPAQDKVLHEYFPDAPHLTTLATNISLVLLNAHYSVVETPRPYMPNMIPIGGFHVQTQPLPKDLKAYMDEAKQGVILFSLGSNFKSTDLPAEKLNIILKTFAKFPQRFLWKFENDSLVVPQNVMIRKWLPQTGVLDHPNIKAFISHGGLLSVTEAVFYGVPFVGIPVFGDQHYNVVNAVHRKFALQYNMNELAEDTFTAVIREILENPLYKENIATRSSLLREQPIKPLDLAVYWVEHVVKYKGAPHLQNAGVKLGWIQAYLIDVFAFLAAIMATFVIVCYFILRTFVRCLFAKKYKKD